MQVVTINLVDMLQYAEVHHIPRLANAQFFSI